MSIYVLGWYFFSKIKGRKNKSEGQGKKKNIPAKKKKKKGGTTKKKRAA